jgi:hypothetical protein
MSDSTIASQDVDSASPTEDQNSTVPVERDIAWRRILAYLIDFKLILAGPFYLFMQMESQAPNAIKIAPYAHWFGLDGCLSAIRDYVGWSKCRDAIVWHQVGQARWF